MDFTGRLVENFFRRWYLYVLPAVLIAGLGVVSALGLQGSYRSVSTLSASTNPLVGQVQISGAEIGPYESAAGATARLINEQLQTDAFVEDVAARAGLSDALSSGLYTLNDVRASVWSHDSGQSLLRVNAYWEEPQVAFALVEGTIEAYQDHLADIVSSDGVEAISFWESKEADATAEIERAEADLLAYLESLPPIGPDDERSPVEQLEIARLNDAVAQARSEVAAARDSIDAAELNVEQASSESGQLVRMVDPPAVPQAPDPVRRKQLITVVMFTMLGTAVSAGAVLLVTAADRTIRSPAQLASHSAVGAAVVLPQMRRLRTPRGPRRPEEAA